MNVVWWVQYIVIAWTSENEIVNGTWDKPDWVTVDNKVNSFTVLLNQITSIWSKKLVLQAIIQGIIKCLKT